MNRLEAIAYIENRPWQGSALGLERMRELMDKLGNPQKSLKCIHVAGTNGKGSCCAMLTSILMEAGYKVGTYTSPHLINYEERFCINNQAIPEKDFVRLTKKVKEAAATLNFEPRVFEILTAIGFLYFKQQKVDIVVLEVGLGGRLDATNVIDNSVVSVLMNIGLEHTEILGDTLAKIAKEKAGIIKNGGTVVAYDNVNEVKEVFEEVALTKKADLTFATFNKLELLKADENGQLFNYGGLKNIPLALLGKHQLKNAAVVIEVIKCLRKKAYKITNKHLKAGLRKANWAARLVVLNKEPLFILDGAHNLQCAEALKETLPSILKKKKAIFLCGILKDKDYQSVMNLMLPLAKEFICVTPNSHRALNGEELKQIIIAKGKIASYCPSVNEGIKLALSKANKTPIIAFGSLYLAGDILANFNCSYKEYLRTIYRKKREQLGNKKKINLSKQIVERIRKTKEYQKAKNILIYKAKGQEVDLSGLTNDKTKVFAYPKCLDDNLVALIPNSDMDFETGPYGIEEPLKMKSKPMKKPDLVICPLLSFDENLNRLGQGKGYYDRYLSKQSTISMGVAYELQKVKELPVETNDVSLKLVCTESKTYR